MTGIGVDLDKSGNRTVSAEPSAAAAVPVSASNEIRITDKFEGIFADHFSGYQITKEAPPQDLGFAAASPCRPYSYALRSGGKTAAVIMPTPHNRYQNQAFSNEKQAAAQAGVPFLNFFTHFDNAPGYVINRIQGAL